MKLWKVPLLIVLLALSSCKNKESQTVAKKEYNLLKKASWFIGNWENVSKEMTMKEIWNKKSDSSYAAISYVMIAKDTVFYEKVDLVQRNDSLFYIVSVREQNKEEPVSFYLTKATDSQLLFENPKHDFPNKIAYTKIANDSIIAEIFGTRRGKAASEIFPMQRSK